MNEPWWKRIDIIQFASVLMTLKVLLPYSALVTILPFTDNMLLSTCLFLFFTQFCTQALHVKTFFICMFLCAVSAFTCIIIDDFSLLITTLTISVLLHYDVKKFVRMVFWTSLIFCALHIGYTLLYSVCFSPAPFILSSGGRVRFTFGFVHPNISGTLIASTLMMYLWLYSKRYFGLKLLVALFIQVVVFFFIDSRTSLLAGLLNLALLAWVRRVKPKKLVRFLLCVVIPGLALFMLAMMHLYISRNGLAVKVNDLLNNRILLGAYAYDHLGLSVIGQYVPYRNNMQWDPVWQLTTFTFDNAYSYLLVQGGLFWIATLSLIFILVSRKISTQNGVFLLIWAIYGMCENTVLNGYTMFPIFLIADAFAHPQQPLKKQKE